MKTLIVNTFTLLIMLSCSQKNEGTLNVQQLSEIDFALAKDSVLLDVRTPKEYEFGNIASSLNIDVLSTAYFLNSISQLDKSKHYFIICRSGSRSLKAIETMKELGFKNLYNVSGGMLEWEKQGLPVEK